MVSHTHLRCFLVRVLNPLQTNIALNLISVLEKLALRLLLTNLVYTVKADHYYHEDPLTN